MRRDLSSQPQEESCCLSWEASPTNRWGWGDSWEGTPAQRLKTLGSKEWYLQNTDIVFMDICESLRLKRAPHSTPWKEKGKDIVMTLQSVPWLSVNHKVKGLRLLYTHPATEAYKLLLSLHMSLRDFSSPREQIFSQYSLHHLNSTAYII